MFKIKEKDKKVVDNEAKFVDDVIHKFYQDFNDKKEEMFKAENTFIITYKK